MRQSLSFTDVHRFDQMSNRELCHWLRTEGGVIWIATDLEQLPHGDLVSMACDALRERRTNDDTGR